MKAGPVGHASRVPRLLTMKPGAIFKYIGSQDITYWSILVYLFFEYVRPQAIWPAMAFLPWAQIVLLTAIGSFLLTGHWFKAKNPLNGLVLLYGAVVLLSSFTAYDFSASQEAWAIIFDWIIIYFLITNILKTPERFTVFLITYLIYNLYMSQGAARQWAGRGFSFAAWGVLGAPGWFRNSGEFGVEMCVFLAISWHFWLAAKPYLSTWVKPLVLAMPVTALMGCVASSSRGAQLGAACIMLWALLRSKARVKALTGLAVVGVIGFAILPQEQKQRFTDMGSDSTSQRRLTYWKNGMEMAQDHPALGIGYGNWMTYYADHYVDRSAPITYEMGLVQLPHNIFIEAVAELGYIGLIVLLLLIVWTFVVNFRTRKMARDGPEPSNLFVQMAYGFDGALVGLAVSGFFVTVLYYPFLWINLAFTVALNAVTRNERHKWQRAALAAAQQPPPGAPTSPVAALPNARFQGWRRRR